MTKEEAEQLVKDKQHLLKKPVKYQNDSWMLADLHWRKILNSDEEYMVVAKLMQSKSMVDEFQMVFPEDFDIFLHE